MGVTVIGLAEHFGQNLSVTCTFLLYTSNLKVEIRKISILLVHCSKRHCTRNLSPVVFDRKLHCGPWNMKIGEELPL